MLVLLTVVEVVMVVIGGGSERGSCGDVGCSDGGSGGGDYSDFSEGG